MIFTEGRNFTISLLQFLVYSPSVSMAEDMLEVEELRQKKRRFRVKKFAKNSTRLHCTSRLEIPDQNK